MARSVRQQSHTACGDCCDCLEGWRRSRARRNGPHYGGRVPRFAVCRVVRELRSIWLAVASVLRTGSGQRHINSRTARPGDGRRARVLGRVRRRYKPPIARIPIRRRDCRETLERRECARCDHGRTPASRAPLPYDESRAGCGTCERSELLPSRIRARVYSTMGSGAHRVHVSSVKMKTVHQAARTSRNCCHNNRVVTQPLCDDFVKAETRLWCCCA